jgi:lipopolysaccharide transport system permease protein
MEDPIEPTGMSEGALKELWSYRELFYFLAWRDVMLRYRQTVLGVAWAIIQPLLTTVIFTVLFGRVAKIPSEGIPYALFAYTGLLPWMFFSTALSTSSGSMVGNAGLIRKVYFPRVAIPGAAIVACLPDLAAGAAILIVMMVYFGYKLTLFALLWPLLLFQMLILTLGASLILAALNVRYRDVKHAVPFALQIGMFLTPIIYPTNIVPERFRFLLAMNPMGPVIEGMRASLLGTRAFNWGLTGISVAMTGLIFFVGIAYFRRAERAFADVI